MAVGEGWIHGLQLVVHLCGSVAVGGLHGHGGSPWQWACGWIQGLQLAVGLCGSVVGLWLLGGLHGCGSMVGSLVFSSWWGSVGPWGSLTVGVLHGCGSMVGSMVFSSWCICVGLWTLGISMAMGPWLDLWSSLHGGVWLWVCGSWGSPWPWGISMAVGPWLDPGSSAHGGALWVCGGSVTVGRLDGCGAIAGCSPHGCGSGIYVI